MRRFVALTWPPAGADQDVVRDLRRRLEGRPRWQLLADRPGMLVFATPADSGATRVYRLSGEGGPVEHGVILGTLFARRAVDRFEAGDGPPAEPVLTATDARAIAETRGRHLIDHYWGRYVALLFDPTSGARTVLRDPSGALSCYYTDHRGAGIHFSDIDDVLGLDLPPFAIDWRHVGRHLHFELDQTGASGLDRVRALLPGQRRVTTREGAHLSQAWDPVDVAGSGVVDDLDEATRLLARTGRACMAAWASRFDHIVHRLSGGLDSAIILGCLAAVDRSKVTALHYTSEHADSDERGHARRAAAHAGVRLLERPVCRPTVDDGALAAMPPTARPTSYHYGLSAAPFEARLSRELGADGFTTGHGGDEVLGATHHPLGVVDYVRRRGLDRALVRTALDAALLSRTSLWSVLALALRHGVLGRACDVRARLAVPMSDALAPRLRDSLRVDDVEHPSLAGARLPPGKLIHVFLTQTPHNDATLAAGPDWLDQVHPFHSQPLVELCLRTPIYLLSIDGRNRGLARAAFAGLVAPEVLARNAKGSGDLHHGETARDHYTTARRHLEGGLLVARGLLDRRALEQMFDGESPELSSLRPQLLHYLYTEHWARRWE
ncbi:MAG TPA: asparagine synthase C-terminal domain-containing protein [Kofleriaceae bacterium]|nr:asparagine synthase C-terminal domain-containing protein [Kofleriaceae bacterium]